MTRPVPARSASTRTGCVDHGESKLAARKHVGQLLDINPATLRNWIEAEQRATRPATARETAAEDAAAEPGSTAGFPASVLIFSWLDVARGV